MTELLPTLINEHGFLRRGRVHWPTQHYYSEKFGNSGDIIPLTKIDEDFIKKRRDRFGSKPNCNL